MKFKSTILFCAISTNIGCTLIGYTLGESVDKATSSDKHANQYAKEGFDVDVEIAKALLTKEKKKETWNDPWVEEQELKYCSQVPNCWSKRTLRIDNITRPDTK